jgi:hypothetical protein
MFPWTTTVMAEQKLVDLRTECLRRRGYGSSVRDDRARRRAKRTTTGWQCLSEWAGYKMIGIGCRLARPAVVARVQAEL